MLNRKRFNRRVDETLNIPEKANRILNIVLIAMLLILLRIWHLAIVQYDEKLDESRKPQRRVVLEPAKRATISDRFNIPLAVNKLQYNAAILYSQIKQVPSIGWEKDADGKRVKKFKRREYITALAQLIAKELGLDAERIEDLIHAKAALYNQIPFVLKENISEQEYYRLKMLEKDWVGIHVQRASWRFYPMGKVASDIVGYMGAINHQEYEKIIREMASLNEFAIATDIGEAALLPEGMETVDEARRRLKDLQELAYSANDSIGKSGVEGRFENTLRGFRGKRSYYSDIDGNFLRDLPGTRKPLPGKRVLLTISSELQEYAEQLLIENENIRQPIMSPLGPIKRNMAADKQPWIKGGAVVAIDPNNGEVIALATYPRFDPNDFVLSRGIEENTRRKENILQWLESDIYLGQIWDRQRPLEREVSNLVQGIYIDVMPLTWDNYLNFVLSKKSPLKNSVLTQGTVYDAVIVQRNVEALLTALNTDAYQAFNVLYGPDGHQIHGKVISSMGDLLTEHATELQECKKNLGVYLEQINLNYDKVLLVDLLRLAVPVDKFSDTLLSYVGKQPLTTYREASGAMVKIQDVVKKISKEVFHDNDFKIWRQGHEKEFLKQKRLEEQASHKYARPYIDYLDALESEMFKAFWQVHRWELMIAFLKGSPQQESLVDQQIEHDTLVAHQISLGNWYREFHQGAHQQIDWASSYAILTTIVDKLPDGLDVQYLQTLRSFHELQRPLLGRYRSLRKNKDGTQEEWHLAAAFYPKYGYGYGRSQAYRQATTQGSIFKLITAYEALVQQYRRLEEAGLDTTNLNPLTMTDRVWRKGKDLFVGNHADGTPIPRHYKGGRMPRSLSANLGKIDVLRALEVSSNPYFALLAGDVLENPEDLADAARKFSYGSRTGIDLPGEIGGNIPDDLDYNRTGLHSFSIGQHTLVATPIQTGIMLSALANGGNVYKPKIVGSLAGKAPTRGEELTSGHRNFPWQEELGWVGIDFPLFIGADTEQDESLVQEIPPQIKREVFLPEKIQAILLEAMCRVVERTQRDSLMSLSRLYRNHPEAISDYIELKKQFIGKTSTSESVENMDLDLNGGTNIYTHVWFGGISYEKDIYNDDGHKFVFHNAMGSPELVVVVYLRYGGYGKEAAPVAAQIANKWKEIKNHAHPRIN
ncbi:MAG: penicillin-binding transpeptidase domain-containing protein [Parachlamydiaceae bacterium]